MSSMERPSERQVWVPDKVRVWRLSKLLVSDDSSGSAVVEGSGGQETHQMNELHILDPTHLQDLDNLCDMNNLHEAPLLDMLYRRFMADRIYTNTGNVLISINPYKTIERLYDTPLQYTTPIAVSEFTSLINMPPHVFKIANNAYTCLISPTGTNQSVIISGESGAGKTEASKYVMQFLIAANAEHIHAMTEEQVAIGEHIKDVLLESNCLLEAFGNAKTLRNDNSSRFGKYIKLQYSADEKLCSAFTETFLLEKSRLTHLNNGERNYHIFYELLRGLNDATLKAELNLESPDIFRILTAGNCTIIGRPELDAEEFFSVDHALGTMGVSIAEKVQIWRLLACILHLGNITCSAPQEHARTVLDCTTLPIATIAELLGVTAEQFHDRITSHIVKVVRRSMVTKLLSPEDTSNNLLALAKWLYSLLFRWIVRKINQMHTSMSGGHTSAQRFIGILDIFGFEILSTNSFEQLCINFTNERLQQQFNEHVFVDEQLVYEKEGLNWTTISFQNNQHVIDLISKKPTGLFYILEEHGMMNRKPDDQALLSSFHTTHDGKHAAYAKPRFGNEGFLIRHFAGDVTYEINGFLSKNNDTLQDDMMELMLCSTNPFLLNIADITTSENDLGYVPLPNVEAPAEEEKKKATKMASASTVSLRFRNQLDELMGTLRATYPHYIKCIKPNNNKAAHDFNAALVMQQLKYSGVLEVVRIRREGYPQRCEFSDFYTDFEVLAREFVRAAGKSPDAATFTKAQLKDIVTKIATRHLPATEFQVGHERLFLRDGAYDFMKNALKKHFSDKASKIIGKYKALIARRRYKAQRSSAVILQAAIRRHQAQVKFMKCIRGIRALQWLIVGKRLRREFRAQYAATLKAQQWWRGRAARLHYLADLRRVLLVECAIRKFLAVRRRRALARARNERIAATTIQCKQRQRRAKKVLSEKKHIYHESRRIASTNIQRCIRGKRARIAASQLRHSVVLITAKLAAHYRRRIAQRRYKKQVANIVLVQCLVRLVAARRLAMKRRGMLSIMQRNARTFLCQRRYRRVLRYIIQLQTLYRRHHEHQHYQHKRKCILHIQTAYRKHKHQSAYQKSKSRAVLLQAHVRRYKQQKTYYRNRQHIILLQTLWRGIMAASRYKCMKRQIIVAQKTYRVHAARQLYLRKLRAAVIIQSSYRRHAASTKYARGKKQCIIAQSVVRCHLQRKRYLTSVLRVTRVAALVRRFLSRLAFQRQRRLAIKLQSLNRMHVARVTYIRKRVMSIRLAALIRMKLQRWRYLKQCKATRRLQIAIRAFLRNRSLAKTLEFIAQLCAKGDPAELLQLIGEYDEVAPNTYGGYSKYLGRQLLLLRYRHKQFKSCLHIALAEGNLNMARSLRPAPADILAKDALGNAAAHHAATAPNVDTFKFLAEAMEERFNSLVGEEDSLSSYIDGSRQELAHQSSLGMEEGGDDESDDDGDGVQIARHGDCVKEGWLKKRREGGRWQKRWIIADEKTLFYYKRKGDKEPKGAIPLDGSDIRRAPGKDPVFIVTNACLRQKKKHKPEMHFLAENEKELQEWLVPLRALTGVVETFRSEPAVVYMNNELRSKWLSDVNADGETPLHVLSRFRNVADGGGMKIPAARLSQLAMWLLENGCPINAQNGKYKQTALHVAVRYGNIELAKCLVSKGIDVTIRNVDGHTVFDLSTADLVKEINLCVSSNAAIIKDRLPLLDITSANRIRGYTYLSFHFQKHSEISAEGRPSLEALEYPHLTISVLNRHKAVIETVQDVPFPVTRRSTYYWWGCTWHMQTPLENLEDGCCVLLELKNAQPNQAPVSTSFFSSKKAAPPSQPLAWHMFVIDLASINSGVVTMEFMKYPVIHPADKAPVLPQSDASFLEAELILSKRARYVDLNEYRLQPEWINHTPAAILLKPEMRIAAPRVSCPINVKKVFGVDNWTDPDANSKAVPKLTAEEIQQMGIKDLKRHLDEYQVDYSMCVEKNELRQALLCAVSK